MAISNLLTLGFDTVLINKVNSHFLNLSALKGMNQAALVNIGFSDSEAILIRSKVNRSPIPKETIKSLIESCGGVCCYCADGINTKPYQVHHIDDYAKSQSHSLNNLLVVCPTHHVNIHQKKLPIEGQLLQKRSWENLWAIAKSYRQKSLVFPFGAIEHVDYKADGSITEIFSFGPPKPAICGKLTEGPILHDAINTLNKYNKIILSGNSGSGKTTLSLGIASKVTDAIIFRYVASDKSSTDIAKEILLFLELASTKILLIIDDANTKIQPQQIEQISAAASEEKKIILINTRETLASLQNFEQRIYHSIVPITWKALQDTVKSNLLLHEIEVLNFLKANKLDNFHNQKIGYSLMDRSLSYVMDFYATGTDSVWQFIFMLASGIEKMDTIQVELIGRERQDLLVSFIGLKQIATVEAGTTIEEIQEFFRYHTKLKALPAPSLEWIRSTLEDLINSRIVKRTRDRFNLVHRMFALNFLEVCFLKSRGDIYEILDLYFKQQTQTSIKETLILWSWLSSTTLNSYIVSWKASLKLDQWRNIGVLASSESLFSLKMLCDRLHPNNDEVLHEILKDKSDIISGYFNNPIPDALYYLSQVSTAIRYHSPEIWPTILIQVDQSKFATLIKDSDPWLYSEVGHLFYALDEAGQTEWIISFSSFFCISDFICAAKRLKKGQIREFSGIIQFHRRYVANLRKSEFVEYIKVLRDLIRDCSIQKLDFPFDYDGFWDVLGYPEMVNSIVDVLNPDQLAEEFVTLTPKHWENLLHVSILSERGTHKGIKDFLDLVRIDDLRQNIQLHYLDHIHEFRVIIYQLGFARTKKKKEFASMLLPFVTNVVNVDPITKALKYSDVLIAYSNLDRAWVNKFCDDNQVSIKEEIAEMRKHNINFSKFLENIEQNEKVGQDYYIYGYRI